MTAAATTDVRERPLLFSTPLVPKLLDGSKTQTRRVAETFASDASSTGHFICLSGDRWIETDERAISYCPYGRPGDRLRVKETWALLRFYVEHEINYIDEWDGPLPKQCLPGWDVVYKADGFWTEDNPDDRGFAWRPSIFMPRWASRITLELTDVRVQRLQEISHPDIAAEGILDYWDPEFSRTPYNYGRDKQLFAQLWDSINGRRPGCDWDSDPYVWALTFWRLP